MRLSVSGRKHSPIIDLAITEVELLENDQPVEVLSLRLLARSPESGSSADLEQSPGAWSAGSALVLYVDLPAIPPNHWHRVRTNLVSALESETWPADTRLMVRGRGQEAPAVAVGIPDALQLLANLPKPGATAARILIERENAIGDMFQMGGCRMIFAALSRVQEYRATVERRDDQTIRELARAIVAASQLTAPTVVFIGRGFELNPGLELYQRLASRCYRDSAMILSESQSSPKTQAAEQLASIAQTSRVRLVVMGTNGTLSEDPSLQYRSVRVSNLTDGLALAARETGGFVIRGVDRPTLPLKRRLDSPEYELTYRAQDPRAAERTIEIRPRGPRRKELRFSYSRRIAPQPKGTNYLRLSSSAFSLDFDRRDFPVEAQIRREKGGGAVLIVVAVSPNTSGFEPEGRLTFFVSGWSTKEHPPTGIRTSHFRWEDGTPAENAGGIPGSPRRYGLRFPIGGHDTIVIGAHYEPTSQVNVRKYRIPD